MKFRKLHFKRLLIFSLILLSSGTFLGFRYSYKLKNLISYLDVSDEVTILTEESLVNEVKNVNKLIPLEVELGQSILIDKSFWDLEVFKKSKTITFFAKCSYSIDFSTITTKDIILDNTNKHITISILSPEIFGLHIDENKTKYSEPELGLLRFGDIHLSSEEFGDLRVKLYDEFKRKMQDEDLQTQAISNTKDSLEALIYNLIGEHYTIDVKTIDI